MSVSLIRCLLAVLALSETCDAVASKDVARLLGVKRPTIHRTLQLLVEKGLIEKELYGDVFLTEKGRAVGEQIAERIRSILDAVSHTLTEEERAAFYRSLSAISRSLDAIAQNSEA